MVGTTLAGRYRLERFLRIGRFGRVYRASDRGGRTVAIKLFDAELMHDPIAAERFDREVVVLQDLVAAHPGVPRLLDHGQTDTGQAFVVTEWVTGTPLQQVLEAGPLPVERVRPIGVQAALVLQAAHTRGIVHRDLSPATLFLAGDGDGEDLVKVLDFGLAHWKVPAGAELTATGTRLGNAAYMAPEYIEDDRALEPRADLYALGVVLYEMLTGAPPFTGNRFAVLQAHVNQPVPAPSAGGAEVPRWLDKLVLRMLSKSPGHRPRSAHSVAHALLVGE